MSHSNFAPKLFTEIEDLVTNEEMQELLDLKSKAYSGDQKFVMPYRIRLADLYRKYTGHN